MERMCVIPLYRPLTLDIFLSLCLSFSSVYAFVAVYCRSLVSSLHKVDCNREWERAAALNGVFVLVLIP